MKTYKAKNGKSYTKKQIVEAIAYWENRLVSLNESNDDEFKKINDIAKYLDGKKDLKWIKVVKFQRLNAKQSEGGEEVETIGSDGNKETKRTTKKDDWIVNNVSNPDNKWIIDDKTFKKKYEEEKDGVYKPKGGLMLAAKVSDCEDTGVEFAPPNWGGNVIKIKNDGWFMKDPSNKKDIYAISKKDFDSTYKQINESALNKSLSSAVDKINSIQNIVAKNEKVKVSIDGSRGDKQNIVDAIRISLLASAARDGDTIDDYVDEIIDTANKSGIKSTDKNLAISKQGSDSYLIPGYETIEYDDIEKAVDESMKKAYTKRQIAEAIAYWEKQLNKMDEDEVHDEQVHDETELILDIPNMPPVDVEFEGEWHGVRFAIDLFTDALNHMKSVDPAKYGAVKMHVKH